MAESMVSKSVGLPHDPANIIRHRAFIAQSTRIDHADPAEGAPATLGEAFAIINSATHPTLDVLKLMVLAEAAGKTLYEGLADQVSNAAVQALLRHNGREETEHGMRLQQAADLLQAA